MDSSFSGKVIAITGAASGIGMATAKLLASRGATLSLADRDQTGLATAIKALEGTGHMTTVVDVRDSKAVNGWIEKTVQQLGKLDGAANLAGVADMNQPIRTETDEGWDHAMDINAKGVFYCIRAELNHISPKGSIVSAASVAGQLGFPGLGSYSASKHAVIGLSRSAAKENPDIRVNCIAPGAINTPMMQGHTSQIEAETALQIQPRMAEAVEVSRVAAFLLSDQASFVTGAVYNVDGGFNC